MAAVSKRGSYLTSNPKSGRGQEVFTGVVDRSGRKRGGERRPDFLLRRVGEREVLV